ncbi:MAG: glycerol-3-phosphate dehydrogenase/oxidase, partial [Planctomycetota bacterium]
DVIVIGGGAVGAGVALDAVSRGYSCVLLEQHDFGKGTSSRSTKLIHGGVRYLAQGNVSLVREALRERGWLLRNASALVEPLRFIIPCESLAARWYYWAGMKGYDALAGSFRIEASRGLSGSEVQAAIPGLRRTACGGVAYHDAQFDDARLLIAVLQQVAAQGGVPLNYCSVTGLLQDKSRVVGVRARDEESGASLELMGRAVVNATGSFSDEVRQWDTADGEAWISHSQGIHLVVDQRFLGGQDALMIPRTDDGRVLFAIPWLGRAVLGTTDTPVATASLEPRALQQEVTYLLEHFHAYLDPAPRREDVRSVFAGLRPLVKPPRDRGATSKISREHRVLASDAGLITVLGGKWTTFRKMGADVVDVVEQIMGVPHRHSRSDQVTLSCQPLSNPLTRAEVRQAVEREFARTVEDVLSRRSRQLLLAATDSIAAADDVARWMADELQRPAGWSQAQVDAYRTLARGYLPQFRST